MLCLVHIPDWQCTYSNAIVPALPFGLPRLDTHATTHCPTAQAMASLDFVGNYPDLEQNFVGVPGPAAEGQLGMGAGVGGERLRGRKGGRGGGMLWGGKLCG